MSDYVFSAAERFAVFQVHGARCYMCSNPITLTTMQVDHIIPEHLLKDPIALTSNLTELGLPDDFDLNSYENWLPSCAKCNNQKRGYVFGAAPIHLSCLKKAANGAVKCRELEQKTVRNNEIARSLAYLERAAESDKLDYKQLEPLIIAYAKADPVAWRALVSKSENSHPDMLGLIVAPEFAITPYYKVLYTSGSIQIVQTPRGTGYVPTDPNPHHSFYCGHCGSKGPWNGARCLSCGMLDDGD